MTTQTINIDAYDYGSATFAVRLRDASDLSVTEATAATVAVSANVAARYIATFTTLVSAGVYYVEFEVDGAIYPQWVTLTGVDGEATETRNDRGAVLLTATQTSIDAILVDTNDLQTNQGNWLTATGFSTPTNVSDVQTAVLAKLPSALVGGKMSSDAVALGGSTAAADNIALSGAVIGVATVTTAASTTSIPTSACTPSGGVADQFKGRIIMFTSTTATAALRGQATDILASSNAAAPVFTVTALTTSPASGDIFIIV